jgi:hypothetical protein
MTPEQESAARLTGAVWGAVAAAGGPHAARFLHSPAALERAFLSALPLPGGRAGHPAATLDRAGGLVRHPAREAMEAAYARRPTTRVHEDIGWDGDGTATGWARLAADHLIRLAGPPRVTVVVYKSVFGVQELGAHQDMWLGVMIQVSGAKDWQAGEGLLSAGNGDVHRVSMTAGDVLVVPKGLPHDVVTPARPGHSTHLGFAILRDQDQDGHS